jgi:predicted DNA-binding transcriptional regulator AlpA
MVNNESNRRPEVVVEVERLWTVPEMATTTGVSATTWRREIESGCLSFTDVGNGLQRRSIRVADSEVRRWLASRPVNTTR